MLIFLKFMSWIVHVRLLSTSNVIVMRGLTFQMSFHRGFISGFIFGAFMFNALFWIFNVTICTFYELECVYGRGIDYRWRLQVGL